MYVNKLNAFAFVCSLAVAGWFTVMPCHAEIKFKEYSLPNGLHVILQEDHSTPIVAVSVMYHVGSKNEDPKRTGFAHFFEHIMFQGSDHVADEQHIKTVSEAGGTGRSRVFADIPG